MSISNKEDDQAYHSLDSIITLHSVREIGRKDGRPDLAQQLGIGDVLMYPRVRFDANTLDDGRQKATRPFRVGSESNIKR